MTASERATSRVASAAKKALGRRVQNSDHAGPHQRESRSGSVRYDRRGGRKDRNTQWLASKSILRRTQRSPWGCDDLHRAITPGLCGPPRGKVER